MHKNFVFYFPYRGVGGVPVLFLRMASLLKNKFSINCYVMDFKDGFMARNLPVGIQLIQYDEDSIVHIPDNSCLIFQSDLPWGIPQNLQIKNNTTIYFWTCYPFNFIPVLPGKYKTWMSQTPFKTKLLLNTLLYPAKLKVKTFLRFIDSKNGVCFMDGTNLDKTENYLDIKIKAPVFVPIMIEQATKKGPAPLTEQLNLCWIGRLGDFKTFVLRRVLKDISRYSLEKKEKISFTIIGNDPSFNIELLLRHQHDYLSITHIEHMSINDIDKFLIQKVNLLFAMGTSALEGAKMAIPTILLNFSYKEVSDEYRYNFIQDTHQFNLGELITARNLKTGIQINEVMGLLKSSYISLSDKSLDYFISNHSSEKWAKTFVEQAEKSELFYSTLIEMRMLNKPFYYSLWKTIKKLR